MYYIPLPFWHKEMPSLSEIIQVSDSLEATKVFWLLMDMFRVGYVERISEDQMVQACAKAYFDNEDINAKGACFAWVVFDYNASSLGVVYADKPYENQDALNSATEVNPKHVMGAGNVASLIADFIGPNGIPPFTKGKKSR